MMRWKWPGRREPSAEVEPVPSAPAERDAWLLLRLGELGGWSGAHAALRLRGLVDSLSMAERVRVDERIREQLARTWSGLPACLKTPEHAARLTLREGTEAAVLGLVAAAPNGYVREAAVRRLALLGGGDELPPLLIRANDWVAPVRQRALDALHARVVPAYTPHWVRALGLVVRLRGTQRGAAGPLMDAVLELLRGDDARAAVLEGLYLPDRAASRACYTILLRPGAPELEDAVLRALGSDDVVVRREAARAAPRLDDRALAKLLPRMMADASVRVRMMAVETAAERMGLDALPLLTDGLLDRGAAVRAHARAIVTRQGAMDFAAFYRDGIAAHAPRLAEHVMGLGETGTAADGPLLRALAAHPRPRVRVAAIRALARLDGDASASLFAVTLGSVSAGVSRAAGDALQGRARLADAAVLASGLDAGHPLHVRRNTLRLLAWSGKWDGLDWILRARVDPDPCIRQAAAGHLERWRRRFNRTFTQPTPAQRERIALAFAAAAPELDVGMVKWLRFAAGIGP